MMFDVGFKILVVVEECFRMISMRIIANDRDGSLEKERRSDGWISVCGHPTIDSARNFAPSNSCLNAKSVELFQLGISGAQNFQVEIWALRA
jgi:hypothetical protein